MPPSSPYLAHLTLTTGHLRRSYREEVGDEALALLAPWLAKSIITGAREPLPVASLAHFAASATVENGPLLCTVWGPPSSQQSAAAVHPAAAIPLVTFGVAQRSRHAAALWPLLLALPGSASELQRPPPPWCAVSLQPGLLLHPSASEWLGDLERCIAWAWITRAPDLEVVR